jgi:hypothetical protein
MKERKREIVNKEKETDRKKEWENKKIEIKERNINKSIMWGKGEWVRRIEY